MKTFEIGFAVHCDSWRLKFGWSRDHCFWGWPGEIESGNSSPAEFFDAPYDEYWLWGWLGFVIYFCRAR